MKIDLKKLGLTPEASLEDVQKKLDELEFFTADEVKEAKDGAATAARKAAEDKYSKNQLNEDELKEFKTYKSNQKIQKIKDEEVIKKINESDRDLIIKSYNLENLEGEELQEALKKIEETESSRFSNELPPIVEEEEDDDENQELHDYENDF